MVLAAHRTILCFCDQMLLSWWSSCSTNFRQLPLLGVFSNFVRRFLNSKVCIEQILLGCVRTKLLQWVLCTGEIHPRFTAAPARRSGKDRGKCSSSKFTNRNYRKKNQRDTFHVISFLVKTQKLFLVSIEKNTCQS